MSATTTAMTGAHAWMKAHVGLAEKPYGSNTVPVDGTTIWKATRPEFEGQPWCGAAVTYAYLKAGVDLRKIFSSPFYCPSIEATAKQRGWWKTSGAKAGDLVLYGAGDRATHVGIASPAPGSLFYALEGNTSSGNSGSQINGGGLYYRGRPRSFVRGWVDMAEALAWAAKTGVWTPPVVKTVTATKSGAIAVDGEWGAGTTKALQRYLGVAADGAMGPKTITALQRKVGATADGEMGPATITALQRFLRVPADGRLGPQTVRALQTMLNR